MHGFGVQRLAYILNHSRPWWWRLLVHFLQAHRWAWQVEADNRLQFEGQEHWSHFQVKGQAHYIQVEPGAVLRGVTLELEGRGHRVLIRKDCVLNHVTVRIRGVRNVLELGERVRFTRGGEVWLEDRHSQVRIGRGSTLVHVHLAANEGTTLHIGQDCLFAYQVEVRTGDSHSILDAATGQRLNPAADVTIGDRVWVGARALILKGARVPEDSVVAAAAVVTQAFHQPGVILAGNPARVIRQGIRWTVARVPTATEASG